MPFMVMLQQFCFAPERAEGLSFTLGIDIAGPYGGNWRVGVKDQQLTVQEGNIVGCQAVLHYKDAEEFCLNAYGRAPSVEVSGDRQLVNRFRGLLFGL